MPPPPRTAPNDHAGGHRRELDRAQSRRSVLAARRARVVQGRLLRARRRELARLSGRQLDGDGLHVPDRARREPRELRRRSGGSRTPGPIALSASPSGTFDQGGNVREWTDTASGLARRVRGGAYDGPSSNLATATSGADVAPGTEAATLGFRVVPEPDGFWSLAAGITALFGLRRRRAVQRRSGARSDHDASP